MRLALALGWSLADIRRYMTCREVQQWRAYYQVEPFGEERADLRAAIISQTISACLSGKAYKLDDFMPDFEREHKGQTEEEMLARIKLAVQVAEKERKNGQHDGSCRIADREDR